MNRFDNGSVSVYTPQSMQELAFVPMMKRSRHDEMSKNLAELDAIATDPLDVHQKEALRIKQEFEGKLGNLSGSLAEKGIDGVGKSDFYKLKKERDNLIAPTGRIGEINASKIALNATKKHFFDTADKKIPQNVLERNWQEHLKKYTGYSDLEKTKIKDIDSIGAVGYQDIEADILRGKQLLGNTTDTQLLNSGAKIQHRPDLGGFIMVSGDGKEITTTNDAQLNAYLKDMNSKWLEENGEGTKYNKFAGISSQNTLSRILNSADMMRDFKRDKSYNENQSFHQYPSSTENEGVNDRQNGPNIIDISNDPVKVSGTETENDFKIKKFEEKFKKDRQSLTPAEIMEYNNLKAHKDTYNFSEQEAKQKYLSDGKLNPKFDEVYYNKLMKYNFEKNKFLNQFKLGSEERNIAEKYITDFSPNSKTVRENSRYVPGLNPQGGGTISPTKALQSVINKANSFRNVQQDLTNYRDKQYKNVNVYSPKSIITYDEKNKDSSNFLQTFLTAFKNTNDLGIGQIIAAKTSDGGKMVPIGGNDSEDVSKIKEIFSSLDKLDSFTINDNKSGIPTITISGKTKKGDTPYDLDGMSSNRGNKYIGGDEKDVSIEIALTNLTQGGRENGPIQPGSIPTELLNLLSKSGKTGNQIAHSIYDRMDQFGKTYR